MNQFSLVELILIEIILIPQTGIETNIRLSDNPKMHVNLHNGDAKAAIIPRLWGSFSLTDGMGVGTCLN